jgi:CHAD domain-containing protein
MTAAAAGRALADILGDLHDYLRLFPQNGGAVGAPSSHIRAYYDTFDGLLHAEGLVAMWEDGELALVESGGDGIRARAPVPEKPSKPLFAWDLEGGRLSDGLKALIDVRALLPLVEIRCKERALDVLDVEGKTVVRMRVVQPRLDDATAARSGEAARQHRRGRALQPRLHVSAVRGYDKALARVSHALEGVLEPAGRSLVDEAVLASGGRPGGSPAKVRVALASSERADGAAAAVLGALLAVIDANLPGTIADLDSEFLHDFRVAVRRTRAVQRELRGVFPAASLARFRDELRWLQRATGDVRDLDVYVLEFDEMRAMVPAGMRGDLEPLLSVLRRRRAGARRRMVRALRSDRVSELLGGWGVFLEELEGLPAEGRPDAAAPIASVAGARIRKVYRRMVRMGSAIGPDSPSVDYHELRKKGKELRYLLELFGAPLFPSDVVREMVRALKGLQDVLGRHQDREVQVAMLRSLGGELAGARGGDARVRGAAGQGGAAALMATGVLIERLEADQLAAREAFAARFAEFASRRQRKLVRDTFR